MYVEGDELRDTFYKLILYFVHNVYVVNFLSIGIYLIKKENNAIIVNYTHTYKSI